MSTRVLSRAELEELPSMWKSPGFIATLIAVGSTFGAFSILLPVVPLAVIDAGGSDALAGATTAIFMAATVLTQYFTPQAIRAVGYRPVMVASAFMLGVPALGHLLGMTVVPALLFSALRGVGFGAITVAQAALIAEIVPLRFLGKASGMLGVCVGLSQMVFLPIGLAVADNVSFTVVYIIAAVIGVSGAALCVLIPPVRPNPVTDNQEESEGFNQRVATWKLITVPAIAISTVAMGFGAVSSFLPAAIRDLDPNTGAFIAGIVLSVVGGAQMIFRFLSGVVADRRGEAGATMRPAQILSALGLVAIAVIIIFEWPSWLLLFAALAFGGGFGAIQNEALLAMFNRLPRSKVSEASALWNMSYDTGTGMGSFVLGIVAARAAYQDAFIVGAGLVVVGLMISYADAVMGRHRIAEYGNTRAQLRQVPVARKAVYGMRKIRRVGASAVPVEALLRRAPRPGGWKRGKKNKKRG